MSSSASSASATCCSSAARRACGRTTAPSSSGSPTGSFDDGRPPARLHGDLWAGNIIWTREGPVLIDPAAHGGHAETDLAMLLLFTAPHIARIIAAYDEAAPLADGWQERVGLHQLFPVMVHAVVFGGDYVRQSVEMARAYA